MKNWRETILSQYDNSHRMLELVQGFNRMVDPAADIDLFHAREFDPRTAVGYGLDVWGRIVGVDRNVQLDGTWDLFGFDGSGLKPFGQAPFWYDNAITTYALEDEPFRLLIFMKAAINITDGSLKSLNSIMQWFFEDRGTVQVIHTGTMKLRFLFRFFLKPYEYAVLASHSGILPVPAGVGVEIYEVPLPVFGFDGSGLSPFNQGCYCPRGIKNAYS